MDAGCYPINLCRYLVGREPAVTRASAKTRGAGIDRAMAIDLDFGEGTTGRIGCSIWSDSVIRMSVHVVGDAGELKAFNPFSPHVAHRVAVRNSKGHRVERFTRRSTYAFQLDAFVAAVRDGGPVVTDVDDAVANMTVIDAAYEASGLGKRQPTP
jgi:predicted dehydrogenase